MTTRIDQRLQVLLYILPIVSLLRPIDAFVSSRYPSHRSQLFVVTPPKTSLQPSWLLDDDDDSDSNHLSTHNPFLEVDTKDTALDENTDDNSDTALLYTRDEADRLEEREDRLYVDEDGRRRAVETCILVGVENVSALRKANVDYFTLSESLTEMRELIKTAGMDLVGEITQRLNQVNPKTYIGTGKVLEANQLLQETNCCTVVFDAELSPGQQKALENTFNKNLLQNDFLVSDMEIKVIDRTALILDIFAQHARTREGKLQVDLALHEYRKPRLTRMWTHLERQSGAGGVGLRGPGESQLEIDKRLLRDRILVLKQKINSIQSQRDIHRRGRERMGLPILSLVGYTNAGKSSMLNYLTRSGVLAESMLFATLDPTTRKVKLPGLKTHPEVLLTDTVGFIQKLPTNLVAAFRATLEEVKQADVLVHVIDVSNPSWEKQEEAVKNVLEEMGVGDKPIVRVLNKIDLLDDPEHIKYEAAIQPLSVAVSATEGDGMSDFVAVVEEAMMELLVPIEVTIPYDLGSELNIVHEQGNVEVVDYRETGTYVRALVPAAVANRLARFNEHAKAAVTQTTKDGDGDEWKAIGRGRHDTSQH